MNALLSVLGFIVGICVILLAPKEGPSAILICLTCASIAGYAISRVKDNREFLLRLFVVALLLRVVVGTLIFYFDLHGFFGPDAFTYDQLGHALLQSWEGEVRRDPIPSLFDVRGNWGMGYVVFTIYWLVGRNLLAVQFLNAVIGSITAPVIFICAYYIYNNIRVAKTAAFCVAFFPSMVLWSSFGLKDALVVFLISISMLATLRIGERVELGYVLILVLALFGLINLRFYIFYMVAVSIAGSFFIRMHRFTLMNFARHLMVLIVVGLSLTYLGVLRSASERFETFGNLEAVQRGRRGLVQSANSGFAESVDVSTTSGALSVIPTGLIYLLFAPFPWQLASSRQILTLPEMIVWWAFFPLLVYGLWFSLRHRLRQSSPILIFTTLLTLSYSIYQGNVGTAYRQRAQILVFYFIFVAVGFVLIRESREVRRP